MARSYKLTGRFKSKSVAVGMTAEDIFRQYATSPQAFLALTPSEQNKLSNKAFQTVNKGLKGLIKSGLKDKSIAKIVDGGSIIDRNGKINHKGGFFSTKGLSGMKLYKELNKAYIVYTKPTSSVRKWKQVQKQTWERVAGDDIEKKLKQKLKEEGYTGKALTQELNNRKADFVGKVMEAYDKWCENNPSFRDNPRYSAQYGSEIQQRISDYLIDGYSVDAIAEMDLDWESFYD